MSSKRIFMLSTMSLALVACSSISSSPDLAVRKAFQRQFKQDSQYNFSGHIQVQLLDNKNASDVVTQPENNNFAQIDESQMVDIPSERQIDTDAYAQLAVAKVLSPRKIRDCDCEHEGYNALSVAYLNDGAPQNKANEAQYEERTKMATKAFVQHWFDSLSIQFSGAVDLPNTRFEIVPQLRYQAPHALSYIELPVQLNFKDWSIMMDTAAIAPYVDAFAGHYSNAKPIKGKILRLQAPPRLLMAIRQNIPLKSLVQTIPQAIDDAYASLDKKAYVVLPMDEAGKKLGATQRIGLKLDFQQNLMLGKAVMASIYRQLQTMAKQQANGFSEEAYAPLLSILAKEQANYEVLTKSPDAQIAVDAAERTVHHERKNVAHQEMMVQLQKILQSGLMNRYLNSIEIYLDKRGRLLAIRENTDIPKVSDSENAKNKRLQLQLWFEYDYSKPRFLLDPLQPNVVNVAEYYPTVGEILNRIEPTKLIDFYRTLSNKSAEANKQIGEGAIEATSKEK